MSNIDILTILESKVEREIKEPKKYAVVLFNDDHTPFDFVVSILIKFFNKSEHDAKVITTNVHNSGKAIAGIYPIDIAEAKVDQVLKLAKQNNYPLNCGVEEEC